MAGEMPPKQWSQRMIDNPRRKDLIRVADHFQCIRVASLMESPLQYIGDLGSDTQDDSAMGRAHGTDRRREFRISRQALPRAAKVRQAMKQNVFARDGQPPFGNTLYPPGSGHDSHRVKHLQVALPKRPGHPRLRPDGSVRRDLVSRVKRDCYFHLSRPSSAFSTRRAEGMFWI